MFVLYNKKKTPELNRQIAYFLSTQTFENLKKSKFYKYHTIYTNTALQSIIVDFNLLFTQMFRTSQIRYQFQKFTMKFTNVFVNWAFDWLVWFNSQWPISGFLYKPVCKFHYELLNLATSEHLSEKYKLKSTVRECCS
jgi:hypothetical protein